MTPWTMTPWIIRLCGQCDSVDNRKLCTIWLWGQYDSVFNNLLRIEFTHYSAAQVSSLPWLGWERLWSFPLEVLHKCSEWKWNEIVKPTREEFTVFLSTDQQTKDKDKKVMFLIDRSTGMLRSFYWKWFTYTLYLETKIKQYVFQFFNFIKII